MPGDEVGDGRTVVLHVDLDCFYAAVEHVRLGIPTVKPLAVQQWDGLIAVNYAARAAGVVRHDRVNSALKKCPELELVHVETVGNEDNAAPDGLPSRSTSKVSLERYRQASGQVFSIFRRFVSICERASIDEAYLDVTSEVDETLKAVADWKVELDKLENPTSSMSMFIEGGPIEIEHPFHKRLLAGAVVAERIRAATREELGYTCSVGIAPNKLLAKIASARNKPDRQTLVLPGAVGTLLQDLPIKKIKLLGGKLGEVLRDRWDCKTAGDVQNISREALVSCFGQRLGLYAWRAVRGVQNDKVQPKQVPKSMLAAKSFPATGDLLEIRRWLVVLSDELSVRILKDLQQNHRQPRQLHLYYRYLDATDHSKSCPMPHAARKLLSSLECPDQVPEEGDEAAGGWPPAATSKSLAKILEDTSFHIFQQLAQGQAFSRLAISATDFEARQGKQSIQKYFQAMQTDRRSSGKAAEVTVEPGGAGGGAVAPGTTSSTGIMSFLTAKPSEIDLDSIDIDQQHKILESIRREGSEDKPTPPAKKPRTISAFFRRKSDRP